mmetsp:Transcript_33955/g.76323  ORF Transcript_33955/g.76323 Transcript_33955/m.76323 type:complete len:108 (+) Transcript_33955:600-923(+)
MLKCLNSRYQASFQAHHLTMNCKSSTSVHALWGYRVKKTGSYGYRLQDLPVTVCKQVAPLHCHAERQCTHGMPQSVIVWLHRVAARKKKQLVYLLPSWDPQTCWDLS